LLAAKLHSDYVKESELETS